MSKHFDELMAHINAVDDICTHDVMRELQRQHEKWGLQNHGVVQWMLILSEEFGEAAKEANEAYFRNKPTEDYRKELVQVAAVAINAIATLDRGIK